MIKIETYALALFESVQEPMRHYNDLKQFYELLQDKEVADVFQRNYGEPKILDPLWDGLGYQVETIRLLKILQADQRIIDMERFIESYQDLLIRHHLLAKADVKVAKSMSNEELENLKALLSKQYPGLIEMQVQEDKELIKGMVVRINNDVIDTSLKHKLDQIKHQGGR